MATKKIPIRAQFGSMTEKLKTEVENHLINQPIESTLVNTLCRPLETSGSVVTCRPLAGYPLEVEWQTKNIVPYPYPRGERTENGITFTPNDDGSITINGTATANAQYRFYLSGERGRAWNVKPGADYTISLKKVSGSFSGSPLVFVANYYKVNDTSQSSWIFERIDQRVASSTMPCPEDCESIGAYLTVPKDTVCTDLVVTLQVEPGTSQTAYEPYVSNSNVNLIPSDISWSYDENLDAPVAHIEYLEMGTYTLYSRTGDVDALAENKKTGEWESVFSEPVSSGSWKSFDHAGGPLRVVDVNFSITSEDFFVKLERGSEYTGTDYSNVTITRCGKNLVPNTYQYGEQTINGVTFTPNEDGSITINGTATANATYRFSYKGLKWNVKPGVSYTLSFRKVSGSFSSKLTFAANYYLASGGSSLSWMSTSIDTQTSNSTKPCPEDLDSILGYITVPSGVTCTDCVVTCQVELGVTATAYEPYREPETFAPGESIPALDGVNTIFADAGLVTVTGKEDYTYKFTDLSDRLAALEAASVNNT